MIKLPMNFNPVSSHRQIDGVDRPFGGKTREVSNRVIWQAIAVAESAFDECWHVLESIISLRNDNLSGEKIVGFQKKLLEAIIQLEAVYRSIKQEQKRLVAKKAEYNTAWFGRRMALLASYLPHILNTLAVGRAIGDGFAWFFYERDRELIAEHLKHPRQRLLPPAIGELGERLTLEVMQGFDKKFLLHHGITTFLRMGDISLIDMQTMRVACIGEVKTKPVDEQHVNLHISFVASNRDQPPDQVFSIQKQSSSNSLTPEMRARLQRQVREMTDAFTRIHSKKPISVDMTCSTFYHTALDDVISRSHFDAFEYIAAGPGLVLGAVRVLREDRTMADFLRSRFSQHIDQLIAKAPSWANKILDPAIERNSLIIGGIGGHADDLITTAESLPLPWWPLKPVNLRQIIFGKVMVVTFYNPAHLWERLRQRKFELEFSKQNHLLRATRKEGARTLQLDNFDYFHKLIRQFLMTEESVTAMIDDTIRVALEQVNSDELRLNIHPRIARMLPDIRRDSRTTNT